MNKRGLSSVVTTVLIILLVLAAASIAGTAIFNLLGDASENMEFAYTGARMGIDSQNLLANPSAKYVKVPVERKPGQGEVKAFKIVISDSSGKTYAKIVNRSLKELETVAVDVFYSQISDAKKVEVFPIFTNTKGKEIVGSEITSYSENIIQVSAPDGKTNLPNGKTALPSSLVGYWTFEEVSGGLVNDVLGSTHLSALNLATSPGKRGNALKLRDDAPGACAAANSGASNNTVGSFSKIADLPQTAYTMSWWSNNLLGSGGTTINLMSSFGVSGCGNCGRWFLTNSFNIRRIENPSDSTSDISYPAVSNNAWHHYIYVFDRTNLKEALYIDGVLVPGTNKALVSGNYGQIIQVNAGVYDLGCSDATPGIAFDELMLYNKAFSAQEAKELYDSYN